MNVIADCQYCLRKLTPSWVPLLAGALLSACGTFGTQDGPPDQPIDTANITDAIPRQEPLSRYGNPDSYVVAGKRYYVLNEASGYNERGIASWYGKKFHGRRTSSGEIYDMYAMTAAHKTLPIPVYVRVTNLDNQRSTIVRVNDRGPFHDNRLIDLSYAAAVKLDVTSSGTAPVQISVVETGQATVDVQDIAALATNTPTKMTASETIATKNRATQTTAMDTKLTHYVQAGAFINRHNAERMLQKITLNTPLPAKIRNGGGTHNPYYRVHIGPFNNRQQVQAAEGQLSNIGINDTLIFVD